MGQIRIITQSYIKLQFLQSGVGAGDRNRHSDREGLVHGPQLRQDLSSLHLLSVQLVHSLTVGGQAGEGDLLDDLRSGRASAAALNNGDLGDAKPVSLSDNRVLGLLALLKKSLEGSGDGDLGLLLLLLDFLLADLLLALDLLLSGLQARAGPLNSVGQGGLFVGLGSTLLGRLDVNLPVSVLVSTQAALLGLGSKMLNFNGFSIVDDSGVGSLQLNNVVSSSKRANL